MLCPVQIEPTSIVTLAHGAGGRLTQQLLDNIIRPAFNNTILAQQHDGALLTLPCSNIAVTTDSYVVSPLFFPGGNIGEMAVIGTLNDLAMCSAKPLYITCAFILTEGLTMKVFQKIVSSMQRAAIENNVQIITGDIKVVEKTQDQSIYINTTGIGMIEACTSPQGIQPGDDIIISGDIGRHGLAVLASRENLQLEPAIVSDLAPLWPKVSTLLAQNCTLHCLRDLTRGGLASALIELAKTSMLSFEIDEAQIPVSLGVMSACEILGMDPFYIANEGRMILFSPKEQTAQILEILKAFPDCFDAQVIGTVKEASSPTSEVILKTKYRSERILSLINGEQLPRIC